MHGKGERIYPSGNYYIGTWKDSKREGKGELRYANSDDHMGTWRN